jgi:hypothetical protein
LRRGGNSFARTFENLVRNKSYFLVTDFDELKKQPDLRTRLQSYPVYAENDGYIIYQLRNPK